jgi:Uri superfamily endonuclease
LADASFIPGFGCSDCKCEAHLIYLPHPTNLRL